ncbi:hypothetical protein PoB_002646000 [Plakobranchus ocellatus]|uniref:Uncharacterized protein n=1 Tax=Plakobranchus ocellatus TaxID=259542 RepID=A0AAV3ZZ62_9GAST|nr:hypothetical protein PoB_002646000 [Plakobranchus ocellatus]
MFTLHIYNDILKGSTAVWPSARGEGSQIKQENANGCGASVVQWISNLPSGRQGPFCCGFKPRNRRPGLKESLKA